MRIRRRTREQRGFALIEVLVALAVLSVGVVAVLGAVVKTLELQRASVLRHRAALVLEDALGEACHTAVAGEDASGVASDPRFRWRRSWTPVVEGAAEGVGSVADLWRVDVEVEWSTGRASGRMSTSQWLCRARAGGSAR